MFSINVLKIRNVYEMYHFNAEVIETEILS